MKSEKSKCLCEGLQGTKNKGFIFIGQGSKAIVSSSRNLMMRVRAKLFLEPASGLICCMKELYGNEIRLNAYLSPSYDKSLGILHLCIIKH